MFRDDVLKKGMDIFLIQVLWYRQTPLFTNKETSMPKKHEHLLITLQTISLNLAIYRTYK
jgi:hypothetical protein